MGHKPILLLSSLGSSRYQHRTRSGQFWCSDSRSSSLRPYTSTCYETINLQYRYTVVVELKVTARSALINRRESILEGFYIYFDSSVAARHIRPKRNKSAGIEGQISSYYKPTAMSSNNADKTMQAEAEVADSNFRRLSDSAQVYGKNTKNDITRYLFLSR